MELDLTKLGYFNPKIRNIFRGICKDNKKNFNNIINEIFDDNLDLSLSLPLSRNTFQSNIFYYLCCIVLIKKIAHSNIKVTKIIVDSDAFVQIIKKLKIDKSIEVVLVNKKRVYISYFFRLIYFFSKEFTKKIVQLFFAKITKKKIIIPEDIILIDTYVLPGFYTRDRYFPGLLNFLSEKEKNKIFFLPTISYSKTWNFFRIFKELRNSSRNFILKEDFLKITDIFYSISYCFRIQFIKIRSLNFCQIDISDLFNEELKNLEGYDLSIEGIINYRFIRRIKKAGIKISTLIDWWENQATDKGLNKGMSEFYRNTKVKGYLGLIPRDMELQLLPIKKEFEKNLVPKSINLIGKSLINDFDYKEMEYGSVKVAPALRFQHVWEKKSEKNFDSKKFLVSVVLPFVDNESINILNLINEIDFNENSDIIVNIKFHPISNKKMIFKNLKSNLNKNLTFIEENSKKILDESNLIISSTSSICLESIVLGVPLIVVRPKSGLEYNPIPKNISKNLYKYCNAEDKIINHIKNFMKIKDFKIKYFDELKDLKNNYFQISSREEVIKFLDL